MVDFNHFKSVYFEECAELLISAEENLIALQSGHLEIDRIHAVFRAIHSIKGGAGSFGFNALVDFSHLFETILDALRDDRLQLTSELCDLLLRANDVLSDLVQAAQQETDPHSPQLYNVQMQLMESVENLQMPASDQKQKSHKGQKSQKNYKNFFKILFSPHLNLMRFGNEPLFILNELSSLKSLEDPDSFHIHTHFSKLPEFYDLVYENCYLEWFIALITTASKERIIEAFEFVEEDCTLEIQLIKQEEIEVSPPQLDQKKESFDSLTTQTINKTIPSQEKEEIAHSIRVELDRIDRLVNTVGEMVIKQAMLMDQAQKLEGDILSPFTKGLQELTHHMRDLQEYVMAIRAQPVKIVFNRMPRFVRELSQTLNKEVHLEMVGENTEIDKTVIERLGEPLTHMIRNAIDHGIESPEIRKSVGKSPYGTICLSAEHKSGRIVIEMNDDGQGIQRAKVLQKAIQNGLVPQDHSLSGEEIDNLIFQPGFSTANEVTNISGRGVGMDVVKKSIQSLGGRVCIQSTEGKGCKFTLTLPLTLAVLDGMIVSCANHLYIVPIINIIETLRPQPSQVSKLVGCHDILTLRHNTIPLIYLHEIFQIPNAITDPCNAIVVVVEAEGGELMGLVVDELQRQQQVVIKSLEENYDSIPGISAATILGNGKVSMILDISALKILAQQHLLSTHETLEGWDHEHKDKRRVLHDAR